MSRISCVRSTTFCFSRDSICRNCAGDSSLSNTTRSTPISSQAAASVSIFPRPRNVAGSGRSRSCSTRSATFAPAAVASPANSSSDRSASARRTRPVIRPTIAARSVVTRPPVPWKREPRRRESAPARRRGHRRWSMARLRASVRHRERDRRASPRASATARASVTAGSPERLALVETMAKPASDASCRAATWSGTRIAMVSVPPCTAATMDGAASTTSVNGPGQNASASRDREPGEPLGRRTSLVDVGRDQRQRQRRRAPLRLEHALDRRRAREDRPPDRRTCPWETRRVRRRAGSPPPAPSRANRGPPGLSSTAPRVHRMLHRVHRSRVTAPRDQLRRSQFDVRRSQRQNLILTSWPSST